MSRTPRKGALFALTVTAGVLLFGSSAFACTRWKGKMTVQGSAGLGTTSAVGSGGQMTYCNLPNPFTETNGGATVNALSPLPGTITVTVQAATCGVTSGQLRPTQVVGVPPVVYTVNYLPAPSTYVPLQQYVPQAPFDPQLFTDCMNGNGQQGGGGPLGVTGAVTSGVGIPIGTINVDINGNGTGTYPLAGIGAAAGPHNSSIVCVSSSDFFDGMQVPFTFV